jgi:thiol-disulfide isomerase/thioredoxin
VSIDGKIQGSWQDGHSRLVRTVAIGFIAVIVGLFAWTAFGSDSESESDGDPAPSQAVEPTTTGASESALGDGSSAGSGSAEAPPDLGPVPELVDISGWLNTDATTFEDARADVTIVQFWTFGCSNCKATLPHLQALYADRRDDGLEIIGVHAHEFERERDPENVAAAVVELGVDWPVALDTNKTNFGEWQGSPRYWPRTYVVDSNNRIRFDHIGEGDYDELAATVDYLLSEQV